jgi:hypothetical protein
MKRIFTLLSLTAILSSFVLAPGIDDIVNALKSGNASQIAKYFDNTVELTLPDKSNSYSKSQAEMILRDFFTGSSVRGFDVIHKGENNGGAIYCIGNLVTKMGVYRTTIFLKMRGNRQIMQEIRFENR